MTPANTQNNLQQIVSDVERKFADLQSKADVLVTSVVRNRTLKINEELEERLATSGASEDEIDEVAGPIRSLLQAELDRLGVEGASKTPVTAAVGSSQASPQRPSQPQSYGSTQPNWGAVSGRSSATPYNSGIETLAKTTEVLAWIYLVLNTIGSFMIMAIETNCYYGECDHPFVAAGLGWLFLGTFGSLFVVTVCRYIAFDVTRRR